MGLMPRPRTLDQQQPPTVLPASVLCPLLLARAPIPSHPPSSPPPSPAARQLGTEAPRQLGTEAPRHRASSRTPPTCQQAAAARGLKYAVDKKQVCRCRRGTGDGGRGEIGERRRKTNARKEGGRAEKRGPIGKGVRAAGLGLGLGLGLAIALGVGVELGVGVDGVERKELERSRCHFHSSAFLFLFSGTFFFFPSTPAVLSTIRYISGHPRHCFRGISSELFARDSFRVATSSHPYPSPLSFPFPLISTRALSRDATTQDSESRPLLFFTLSSFVFRTIVPV